MQPLQDRQIPFPIALTRHLDGPPLRTQPHFQKYRAEAREIGSLGRKVVGRNMWAALLAGIYEVSPTPSSRAYPRHADHRCAMTVVMRSRMRGVHIEPDWATDWDGAAQPAPDFEVDLRISW